MSDALFFVTHEDIASNLLKAGEAITQKPKQNMAHIEIDIDTDMDMAIDQTLDNVEGRISQLNLDDGLLFITDIYGSTPRNVAQLSAIKHNASLISGANLPMVIRLLKYRGESKQDILQKALAGTHQGIQINTPTNTN